MKNKTINWGIIGCGDVTEVKSGPAFNKVANSALLAVMRRNAAKAEDYAKRHHVPLWYADADELLANPDINAVYIATPPSSHEELTIKALQAGKDVYVEKPMALTEVACLRMKAVAEETGRKLSIAHYRRAMPYFNTVKQLIEAHTIGEINHINLKIMQGNENSIITQTEDNWRLNPAVSGGGLFHDLAPHQLDLMIYFFGNVKKASGISVNKSEQGKADDMVTGQMLFENNILFNGFWSFNNPAAENTDLCEIIGTKGKISFGFFGATKITIHIGIEEKVIEIKHPQHVQQPMIEKVVAYFLDNAENPCDATDGAEVLRLIGLFSQ